MRDESHTTELAELEEIERRMYTDNTLARIFGRRADDVREMTNDLGRGRATVHSLDPHSRKVDAA